MRIEPLNPGEIDKLEVIEIEFVKGSPVEYTILDHWLHAGVFAIKVRNAGWTLFPWHTIEKVEWLRQDKL